MLLTAFTGAVMAISFCAPPGPVTMETLRRGLRGGFGPALQVQLGSIVGDVTWCALALVGLGCDPHDCRRHNADRRYFHDAPSGRPNGDGARNHCLVGSAAGAPHTNPLKPFAER